MSPSHDFENIGEVLDFQILKGKITAIDSATDTCTVDVGGASLTALIFYHCKPDSIARDNGAIEGGAGGFKVDDEVVVMINSDNSVVKVIGHIDGIRKCNEYAVFLIASIPLKTVAVIWDIKSNELELGPVDTSSAEYIDWIAAHKTTGDSMFSDPAWDTGEVIDIDGIKTETPHKINPELVDPAENTYLDATYYHAYAEIFVFGYHYYQLFPESMYTLILINPSPPTYAGLRTQQTIHNEESAHECEYYRTMSPGPGTEWLWGPWPMYPEPPGWAATGGERGGNAGTVDSYFFGPLGQMGIFNGTQSASYNGYPNANMYSANDSTTYYIPPWNPTVVSVGGHWMPGVPFSPIAAKGGSPSGGFNEQEVYAMGGQWYGSSLRGKYTDKTFAMCCMVQYTPLTMTDVETISSLDGDLVYDQYSRSLIFGDRVILIQAQAAELPEDKNWQAGGKNTELSELIAAGMNMFYSINSIPEKELRSIAVNVYLRK